MMIMITYKENKAIHFQHVLDKQEKDKQIQNKKEDTINIVIAATSNRTRLNSKLIAAAANPTGINRISDHISNNNSRNQDNSPIKLYPLQHNENEKDDDEEEDFSNKNREEKWVEQEEKNEEHKQGEEDEEDEEHDQEEMSEKIENKSQQQQQPKSSANPKPGAFTVMFTTFSQISSILSNFDVGSATTIVSVSVAVGNSSTEAVSPSSVSTYY